MPARPKPAKTAPIPHEAEEWGRRKLTGDEKVDAMEAKTVTAMATMTQLEERRWHELEETAEAHCDTGTLRETTLARRSMP
jgi:hypothetical protein